MQQRHGSLKLDHKYTGQQEIVGYVKQILGTETTWSLLIPVVNTCTSYIRRGNSAMEIDNDPGMQLIRLNWNNNKYSGYDEFEGYGYGMVIKYGTKVYISSEKIQYMDKRITDGIGMKTTMQPSCN